ncbi:MAG: hypothetical protein Kow00102_18080 [Spirochaetota bacterium]
MGYKTIECTGTRHNISGSLGAYCFQCYKDKLYMGGDFTEVGGLSNTEYIARWNGTNWEALPNSYGGIGTTVYDMVVYNDTLLLGTNFPNSFTRVCGYDADIDDYVDMGSVPDNCLALAV